MIEVRHRLASGRADEAWEFDPARRVIDVVLRQGSDTPLAFAVPVCAIDKPRIGAFAMIRFDFESWRILPSRFVLSGERLVHQEIRIHPDLGEHVQLVLTHAPYEVDAELEVMSL